ncbi:hypothetical protein FGM00_09740 [Aggregatimonas sangjinii]|uniref:Uncharacterized protein n=1 Tax=Aggregatimonas sangjinii TaxID=2583587 RepID=A0A5B7SU29_9FLAO|nr:hypothetical protein [Aggregatimonas sangjinii]QCX00380.1 hypothetical protein FGM00_09740 [Aggregatimonas sangjinii]
MLPAIKTKSFLPIFGCFPFLISCGKTSTTGDSVNETVDQNDAALKFLIEDMTLAHEAKPKGVPYADWVDGPRIGYGNSPPDGWTAMMPWGQVYVDETGFQAGNVRFQIRNLQTWYLSKSQGKWLPWRNSSDIDGANYTEDFQDDVNLPADIRIETANGGGISSTLIPGHNFHFWSAEGRVGINPDDIDAVWSAVDARLILENPDGVDERDSARLMMSVGADYWLDLSAPWDQWTTNGDIFIGRFRYMTSEWQRFHAHTLTEEQIEKGLLPPFRVE